MESKRLLLIEARPQPRALLSRSFEKEGFVVTGATGIAEAALRLNPAPDLVVSSFAVSQGDPLDFCRALKTDLASGAALSGRPIPFLYLFDRRRPLPVDRLRASHVEHAVGTPTFVRDVVLAVRLLAEAKEPGCPSFTGALEIYSLPTILRVGSQPDRSSMLTLFSQNEEGLITLRDGFVVGAEAKGARVTLKGLRAFDRVAQWITGGFVLSLLPERTEGKVLLALPVALQRIATSRAAFANALGDDRTDWVYEADYRAIGAQMSDIPRLAVDVAKLMDGKRTVYEILAESRTDEPTTLRIIHRLVERGIAQRVEPTRDELPIEVGPRIAREEAPLPEWEDAPATILSPIPTLFDPDVDGEPKGFPKPVITTLEKPVATTEVREERGLSPVTRERSPWSGAPLIPFGDEKTGTRRSPVAAVHARAEKPVSDKKVEAAPFAPGAFSSEEEAFFINELSTPKLEAVATWPGVERALVAVPAPAVAEEDPQRSVPSAKTASRSATGRAFKARPATRAPEIPRKDAVGAKPRAATSTRKRETTGRASARPLSGVSVGAQAALRASGARGKASHSLVPSRGFSRFAAIGAAVVGVGLLVYGIAAPSSDKSALVIVGSERTEQRPTTPRDDVPSPPLEPRAVAAPAEGAVTAANEAAEQRAAEAASAPAAARPEAPAQPVAAARASAPTETGVPREGAVAHNDGTRDPATQLRRAERLLANGRTGAAVRSLRVVLSLDPEHARARVLLARTLYDQGLVPEAESHVRKGLAVAPRNAELTILAGVIAQSKGNRISATASFERYLKLSPKGRFAGEVREILKGWKR